MRWCPCCDVDRGCRINGTELQLVCSIFALKKKKRAPMQSAWRRVVASDCSVPAQERLAVMHSTLDRPPTLGLAPAMSCRTACALALLICALARPATCMIVLQASGAPSGLLWRGLVHRAFALAVSAATGAGNGRFGQLQISCRPVQLGKGPRASRAPAAGPSDRATLLFMTPT